MKLKTAVDAVLILLFVVIAFQVGVKLGTKRAEIQDRDYLKAIATATLLEAELSLMRASCAD